MAQRGVEDFVTSSRYVVEAACGITVCVLCKREWPPLWSFQTGFSKLKHTNNLTYGLGERFDMLLPINKVSRRKKASLEFHFHHQHAIETISTICTFKK